VLNQEPNEDHTDHEIKELSKTRILSPLNANSADKNTPIKETVKD